MEIEAETERIGKERLGLIKGSFWSTFPDGFDVNAKIGP